MSFLYRPLVVKSENDHFDRNTIDFYVEDHLVVLARCQKLYSFAIILYFQILEK